MHGSYNDVCFFVFIFSSVTTVWGSKTIPYYRSNTPIIDSESPSVLAV